MAAVSHAAGQQHQPHLGVVVDQLATIGMRLLGKGEVAAQAQIHTAEP